MVCSAYGIIEKSGNDQYRVTEIGRKIVAPTYEGENREGIIKAIAKPAILARFYTDYSDSLLPSRGIFRIVLEQGSGIPGNRVDETMQLIVQNAKYAGLLEEQADGKYQLASATVAVGVGPSREATAPSRSFKQWAFGRGRSCDRL